jgi:hypothetical protein
LDGAPNDITETPKFKEWFAGSKVVDDHGRPLRVYHGTSKYIDFASFKMPKNRVWFTSDPKEASMYSTSNDSQKYEFIDGKYKEINTHNRVMPLYLKIINPYRWTEKDQNEIKYAKNYKKAFSIKFLNIKNCGYDGIDMGNGGWVVLNNANQIKSAIGNNGNFDSKSNKITENTNNTSFKQWFNGSKLVDHKGNPLKLYHGTINQFTKFVPSLTGSFGYGIYFANTKESAAAYAEENEANVKTCYIKMLNPLYCKASYEVGEEDEWDVDSPSIPLLIKLFGKNGAHELLNRYADKELMFGKEISNTVIQMGHDDIVATYPDGSKEVIVYSNDQVKIIKGAI